MAVVYIITNAINGKQYVGATILPVEQRWNLHKSDSRKVKDGQAFHAAIRKYGDQNFKVEILYEDADREFVFNFAEEFFIRYHKTHGTEGGYNMTWGGDGRLNSFPTDETREKLRQAKLGKKQPVEMVRKRALAMKGKVPWCKGKICPQLGEINRGRKHTAEARQNMSKANSRPCKNGTKEKIREMNSDKHIIQDPEGNIVEITNLDKFVIDQGWTNKSGLGPGCLKRNGWKRLEHHKKIRKYTVQNIQTKETFETTNLKKSCKERGLPDASSLIGAFSQNKPRGFWQIISKEIAIEVIKFP